MATGVIDGTTSNEYIDSRIRWTSTTNPTNNTSSVSVRLYYKRNNTGYTTYGTGSFTLRIGGYAHTTEATVTIGTSWVEVLHATQTITHNADGTKSILIQASGSISGTTLTSTSCSATVALDTIERASTIYSASNTTLGNLCNIKWYPLNTTFRYKLKFALGNWSYTTGYISPQLTTLYTYNSYTIPLDVANYISSTSTTAKMTVTLYTYPASSSTSIGSTSSKEITVTVPKNTSTQPSYLATLTPFNTLGGTLANLYIQGYTAVKATLSNVTAKYGATITSYSMKVEGVTTKSSTSTFTSSNLIAGSGSIKVQVSVTDSRGFTGESTKTISVLAYSKPRLTVYSGENEILAERCDDHGAFDSSGTRLRIKVGRAFTPLTVDGKQNNFCAIKYRYKAETASSYSSWVTILERTASSNQVDATITDITLIPTSSYMVQIGAVDDILNQSIQTLFVATEMVTFHLKDGGGGAAFGKYAEDDKCLEIAPDWDVIGRVYGLGKSKASIPQNGDANSYTEFGVYSIPSNDCAETISNLPIARAGTLIVSSATGDGNSSGTWAYIRQRFESLDGKHEYHRLVRTAAVAGEYIYDEWVRRGNTNWSGLSLSSSVSQSTHTVGRHTNGDCWYRVVNENHVYVTFNCAFTISNDQTIQVNATALPWEYRPKSNVFAMCPTNAHGIANVTVKPDGNIVVMYVKSMASADMGNPYPVTWIDGYIDFWV